MSEMNVWAMYVGWAVFAFGSAVLLAGMVVSSVELVRAVRTAIAERRAL